MVYSNPHITGQYNRGYYITNPNTVREIPQNYHRFVLFDSPELVHLMIPVIPQKYTLNDQGRFLQSERTSLGFDFSGEISPAIQRVPIFS